MYRETCQHTTTMVTETLNTEIPETLNQRQMLINNNQDTTHPNTVEKTITQEEKINVEIMKRIMSEKKLYCLLSGTKTGKQSRN